MTKEEKAVYNREWRKHNPGYDKEYYAKNKEKIREATRKRNRENPEKKKEAQRKFDAANPTYKKEYYVKNSEKIKKKSRRYHAENTEKIRKTKRVFYLKNSESEKEKAKRWRAENPDKAKKGFQEWRRNNPEKFITNRKRQASLRRTLGFVPLNEPFAGCHAHHINQEEVIYLPVDLHRSISHSVTQNYGMEEINKLAFQYLKKTTPQTILTKKEVFAYVSPQENPGL